MIEIKKKKDCCGCWACENACPKQCISMVEDAEGFRYPKVAKEACIDCHLCEKVCPIVNVKPETEKSQKGYLLQNKDPKVLAESTSGGAYTAIAKYVLRQGGVVFGAALNERNEARHIYVESEDQLWRFRNSKYVQSLIGETFKQAHDFLKKGRMVLFSGTPCQMEGLVSYLRKPYDNLIIVDVVCRAVPSPKVLRKYLEYQSLAYGADLCHLKFRDKKFYGYKYSNMSFDSARGAYHAGIDTDPWLRSFFSGINVRPSCFACRFKKQYRVTDFTIWDCFEVYQYSKELDNDKGVTKVLVHSAKAAEMMKAIGDEAYMKDVGVGKLIAGVHELTAQPKTNPKRKAFFEDLDRLSPKECFDKYFPITFRTKTEKRIRILMLQLGLYKQFRMLVRKMVGEVKR